MVEAVGGMESQEDHEEDCEAGGISHWQQSEKWKWSRSVMSDSFVTPWTVAYQDPLSTGFSKQEYWSGLPFPSPGDPPNPGIELTAKAVINQWGV